MTYAALAVFVYARILTVLIPLISSLGPMLNTVAAMVGDLAAFALPYFFITGAGGEGGGGFGGVCPLYLSFSSRVVGGGRSKQEWTRLEI